MSSVSLRDFRSYHQADVELGPGLTVVCGANGAGKTNLLEALYFGCTGRSCRTANEREVIHFGAGATRIVVLVEDEDGPHELSVGFAPGQPKRFRVDGAAVEKLIDAPGRPLVSVFLPDRLALTKGAPALRRAHLDHFVAALWPARAQTRKDYGQALAQRNALIARIRSGRGSRESLGSWDLQLARHGVALMEDRARAIDSIAPECRRLGALLGLEAELAVGYRPRSRAGTPEELAEELAAHLEQDLTSGFTARGPHRDEVTISLAGRDLRAYGSQGQQRIALLAVLLAEREVLAGHRSGPPVMLLDDVMSELDHTRRQALVDLLAGAGGQAVITTTDAEHVPGTAGTAVVHLSVLEGTVFEAAAAAR